MTLFTHLLAQEWADQAQTRKPTAMSTMLRYSGASGCGRRMAYDWFGAEYSNAPTPASVFQAGVGTVIGELAANVMIAKYGGEAEKPSQINEFLSGSADWYCEDTPLGTIVYEHKKKSSFAFNKAMGYQRGFRTQASFSGVSTAPVEAVVQAGMNALGIEATYGVSVDRVVVGVVSTDVVSIKDTKQMGISDFARFGGEWVIERDVFEPLALSEVARLDEFASIIEIDNLPDRMALDDQRHVKFLSPGGANWQCDYCPYVDLCKKDGPGVLNVEKSRMTRIINEVPTEKEKA